MEKEDIFDIKLKAGTMNLCLQALTELPYKVSANAINDLQTQMNIINAKEQANNVKQAEVVEEEKDK